MARPGPVESSLVVCSHDSQGQFPGVKAMVPREASELLSLGAGVTLQNPVVASEADVPSSDLSCGSSRISGGVSSP